MEITYWSDYACPFCYIGKTNLEKALKEMGLEDVPIRMKAFELDPYAEHGSDKEIAQLLAEKYHISKEQAEQNIEGIHQMAKQAGIDFNYRGVKKANTFNAHRLTKLAAEKGLERQASDLFYKAYFEDHLDLQDEKVLKEIAKELKLDMDEVDAMLAGDLEARDVRIDEFEASQAGVTGVPFFVINEEVAIPGAISSEEWKKILPDFLS